MLADQLARMTLRELRDLAEASTLARDTEVQLGWLEQQREALRPLCGPKPALRMTT